MASAVNQKEKLNLIIQQINNASVHISSGDVLKASAFASDIRIQLRDLYHECVGVNHADTRENTRRIFHEFLAYCLGYLQDPTVASNLELAKNLLWEDYGRRFRESIHADRRQVSFCEKYDRRIGDYVRHAVKISDLTDDVSTEINDPVREAAWYHIVSKDDNPTMLPCVASFALGNQYVCVTPAAKHGTLLDYLIDPGSDKTKLHDMFVDLLYAVSYLHNHLRVAHLNLKPENVLIGKDHQIIVGGLGHALAVANADYEVAKAHMLQHLEARLQRRGASVTEIEQRKQNDLKKFDTLYHKYSKQHQILYALLRASSRDFDELLKGLAPLTVPLAVFFRPSYQRIGFTFDAVLSIDGYTDANDLNMSGETLVQSFLADLRRKHPDEATQKKVLLECTARLKPKLPARLYVAAGDSGAFIQPSMLSGPRGTEQYMCPALVKGEHTNPFAADVYSLGVVLFIVATGFQPYKSLTDRAFHELERGGVAHLLRCYGKLDMVHPSCLALMEKMMKFDPGQRPSIDECVDLFQRVTLIPFT